MSKNPKPTTEELRFVYELLVSGYEEADVLAEYSRLLEAGTLNFPCRTDKRFVRERKRELLTAEQVLKERIKSTDPLVVERKREHFNKLHDLMREWKEQLVAEVTAPLRGYDLIFPTSFTDKDYKLSGIFGPRGSLCWEVTRGGSVDVWFVVERDPLFPSLKEHLSGNDIWDKFDDIKGKIASAIGEVGETGKTSQARNVLQLAYDIAEKLDIEVERVTMAGSCSLCRS